MRKFWASLAVTVCLGAFAVVAAAQGTDKDPGKAVDRVASSAPASDVKGAARFLGAGLAIGCATLAAGIAIGRLGAAAMGAIAERPETSGIALVLAGLAEGICLWGFIIAIFILQR